MSVQGTHAWPIGLKPRGSEKGPEGHPKVGRLDSIINPGTCCFTDQ